MTRASHGGHAKTSQHDGFNHDMEQSIAGRAREKNRWSHLNPPLALEDEPTTAVQPTPATTTTVAYCVSSAHGFTQ
ncbi:hypothetical protein CTRI78_v007568 [Colletotrichum trifolii]|uniref:Uncharacterized protein n=1 Tax=Colletotrichum trifolii TaxID=5466 RepID=A0A4R8R5V3_COLTR|nr:hypothetical protein CTRI78_v007568 [Colletotrichum trifolii]